MSNDKIMKKKKFYIPVRPGLDSRLDIFEPPFEPIGILERLCIDVRVVDDK
jgi:hypothetical protein